MTRLISHNAIDYGNEIIPVPRLQYAATPESLVSALENENSFRGSNPKIAFAPCELDSHPNPFWQDPDDIRSWHKVEDVDGLSGLLPIKTQVLAVRDLIKSLLKRNVNNSVIDVLSNTGEIYSEASWAKNIFNSFKSLKLETNFIIDSKLLQEINLITKKLAERNPTLLNSILTNAAMYTAEWKSSNTANALIWERSLLYRHVFNDTETGEERTEDWRCAANDDKDFGITDVDAPKYCLEQFTGARKWHGLTLDNARLWTRRV